MKLPLARVAEFTSARGDSFPEAMATGYSIDSRTIQAGDLFFAVKGERMDGHDFVERALSAGATVAVVSGEDSNRFTGATRRKLLVVEDTLVALQTLGAAVRRLWGKPLVAVTGSAGKTTTKDTIAHLLGKRLRVLKSQGNLNNHFGLPMQLLRLEPEHEIAVMELGMSHAGEIAALGKLARPDAGVVTCVAPVHLEYFASVAEIARAKFELIESLAAGSLAVLNADDPYVSQFGRDFHGEVVTFGIDHPADVRAEQIQSLGLEGSSFTLAIDGVREEVRFPMLGRHNILNALAASATALHYGVSPSEVAAALGEMTPAEKRGEVFKLPGTEITVINDCYNSNPTALKAMVDSLSSLPAKRRIVVAGEMLELGPEAAELHRDCGAYIASRADLLYGVRGLAAEMAQAAQALGRQALFFSNPEEAGQALTIELRDGDAVLFKASRGVKLEGALEIVLGRLGKPGKDISVKK